MIRILTDLIYVVALVLISPMWLYRMARQGRYRSDIGERLGKVPVRHGLQPVIWIHAVSLGEVNGIQTLVRELASQLPDFQIVISSTTDTGMAAGRKLFEPQRKVFRFPMDFSWAVRRAFQRLRPDLVVLMEGEAWPNFLSEASRRGVPVMLVNGRMSANKGYPRYRLIKPVVKRLLFSRLTALAVQDEDYAERFVELGARPESVRVTGTMKFDTAEIADQITGADALAEAVGIRPDDELIVAGGTGDGEEKMLLEMFGSMKRTGGFGPRARLAIVPRKPERFEEVSRLIQQNGFAQVRRSKRPDGSSGKVPYDAIILGDTMGELRKFYSLASAVFVGRSLVAMGGSDMIEAAALGKAVAFGPHAFNFPQAKVLVDGGAARQVANVEELAAVLRGWLENEEESRAVGRRAQDEIRRQQGATRRNVALICEVLGRVPAEREGNIATVKLQPAGPAVE